MELVSQEDKTSAHADLHRLKQEHRDLDDAIAAVNQVGTFDRLQVQRLKKRKLALRDEIMKIEDGLLPDIIA